MLWSVLIVLLILWALGFGFGVLGNFSPPPIGCCSCRPRNAGYFRSSGRLTPRCLSPALTLGEFNVHGICQGVSDALC